MSAKLFNDENSEQEEEVEEVKINSEYAKNYDSWRKKEELHKLQAKYGENAEDLLKIEEEESSESSEDDEGEEIPEEFEKNFYKALACVKSKDPRIYDEKVQFFKDFDKIMADNKIQFKKKKDKSMFLRDYERHIVVEKGGKLSDSEDDDAEKSKAFHKKTYVEEEKEIKESFKKALQDDDAQDDLLLKPKIKTKEQKEKEAEDYKKWLKGQKENIDEEEQKELKPLRDFWTDPNLNENEKFLRDFVLNKKFLDHGSEDSEVDYDHRIHDSDENLSEDEKNINQQEEFEHKYNFRFEEEDPEFIKRYPRTMENSLRKKDTRRAQKRAEVKARKEEEKIKKREELKQLKALKKKEIEEKIEKLKEITGNDDLQFNMIDLDEDFNPDEHDKKMSQIFNEEYYSEQADEIKPEFPEIDEELGVETTWDDYDPTTEEILQEDMPYDGPHCEDPDFNMDADYERNKKLSEEMIESTKRKKRRRRSKFAEVISQEKPTFDPSKHASYKEYYDQYYALDYEDLIGDQPCRFKYRQVVPNDYGLTVEEILMADEKELNKWCSLKRALEYKPEHKELNDVKAYKQKAANENLKRKILKSLYSNPEEKTENLTNVEPDSQQSTEKKGKKKKKNRNNVEVNVTNQSEVKTASSHSHVKDTQNTTNDQVMMNEEKKDSVEEKQNPKKRKREDSIEDGNVEEASSEAKKAKKKKKKKNKNKLNGSLEVPESGDKSKVPVEKTKKTGDSKKNKNVKPNQTGPSKKEERKQRYKKLKKMKEMKEKLKQDDISDKRLLAFSQNPKKFRNKLMYKKKD